MSQRQIIFGIICLLVGILIGMELAANIDVLVRIVIIVVILLLLAYLVLPYLPRWRRLPPAQAQRASRRRTVRKP